MTVSITEVQVIVAREQEKHIYRNEYALLTYGIKYARLTLFTGKNSFEIQIRKRRLISISNDFLLKNEVRRAYYHTWEERIVLSL